MVRLVSGIVLAAAAVAAILFLPIGALRVVSAVVAALASHEYLRIVGTRDAVRQAAGIGATVVLCAWVALQRPIDGEMLLLIALGWVAIDVLATGRPIHAAAADVLAPVYTGAPLGMLVSVHVWQGWQVTLLAVALVVVSDSAQYYSGRMFGRRPLAPAISPKKTVEGAAGGFVAGALLVVIAGQWVFREAAVWPLVLLGLAGVALGICGDLFESRLKRAAGVKDSSSLIPGHGGVLDRIDALLFVAPAFYVYLLN